MSEKAAVDWNNKVRVYEKCPRCAIGYLDTRIRRGFLIKKICFWLDVKRYKCNNCEAKVYVRTKR